MVSPTSQDVARHAGVSVATVSRVLNDLPHVSPGVRRKVLRAVKALNYQPNRTAQRLRAKKSRVIGLVISDIQNPFFTSVVRGIEDVAHRNGYSLLLCNSDEDSAKEQLYINVMRSEEVAGIILASTSEANLPVAELIARHIPVLALDRRLRDVSTDSVLVANTQGAFQAVSHLLELGHTHVGFIGLPLSRTPGKERYEGYLQALRNKGIRPSRRLTRIGDAKEQGGYECTRDLLEGEPNLTALFVANNLMTLGALRAIRELGRSMPGDLSLIGFDDLSWAPLLDPPLTTVAQPTYELGQKAAELLLARLEQPDRPVNHIQLEPTLIVRASCAPPRKL